MINQEYKISEVFLKEPWKALTFSEIQKLSGSKSKSYSYSSVKKLEKKNLIISEKIGKRAIIYRINLNSLFARNYWGFLHEYISQRTLKFPLNVVEKLMAKMPTPFFIMLITGSYARRKQTSKSDLDAVVICNGETDKKRVYQELIHISELSIPRVHLYVFTKEEFVEMLLNNKENYGKEIARNCLIFFGGAIYYSVLKEAMNSGFRG